MAQKTFQMLEPKHVLAFHLLCHRCKMRVRYEASTKPLISLDCPYCFSPWLPDGSADRAALENLLKALVPVLNHAENFPGHLLIEVGLPETVLPLGAQDVDDPVYGTGHQPKHG